MVNHKQSRILPLPPFVLLLTKPAQSRALTPVTRRMCICWMLWLNTCECQIIEQHYGKLKPAVFLG